MGDQDDEMTASGRRAEKVDMEGMEGKAHRVAVRNSQGGHGDLVEQEGIRERRGNVWQREAVVREPWQD